LDVAGPIAGEGAAVPSHHQAELDRRARLKSIGLMIAGVTLFSVLDTSAKYASASVPIIEIVWFRYVIHFIAAAAVLNPWSSPTAWRMSRPYLQILRAVFLVGTTILNFLALRHLQLAETVSINFLSPLLISVLSVIFLAEQIGPRRIAAILVGFGGILLVTRPGLGGFDTAMLYSIGAMTCGSLYALMTRQLARTETAGSMILVLAAVPSILLLPVLPLVWVTPASLQTWALLVLCGLTGGFGHFLLILAHRHAPASVLAPFGYAQIVSMVGLGYLVFGDVPNHWTLLGAGVVIASGLYLFHRERTIGGSGHR
jgi:drug/metabolite transporter (DMT)-like permease